MQPKIKVLVVDDSAMVRALLTQIINANPRLQVVAAAADPYDARELIKQHNPDVITLDIEMPKMNGITFLKNLMRLRPVPVVMISTLTQEGAPSTLEALEYGAVDFLGKPAGADDLGLADYTRLIGEKIYWASKANIKRDFAQTEHRTASLRWVQNQFARDFYAP
ncbi:MAG: response regulator [Cellvibrionaceae bacterium]|nr:response regulator [Cellvibrionaceae bacterium]